MNVDMTPDEIMDRAADLITLRGWNTGGYINWNTGALCVIGALRQVKLESGTSNDWLLSARIVNFLEESQGINDTIAKWNDHICQSREQAVDMLRTQAKRWREEHQ